MSERSAGPMGARKSRLAAAISNPSAVCTTV